ncbi:hypothetical protein Poly30_22830 [Planctomycetes bacterium Poly30]|uniref:LamG-like jellyroll fold domain-containing protein n=1 Tax=Saltatorellus ferox TaxID=2528018 RepID=A0A518ERP0_9BACT|nr:hypothetical protein Poly30_22830 [Planctomycetes bacterium Poly30]
MKLHIHPRLSLHSLASCGLAALALQATASAQGANVCANADVIPALPSTTAFDTASPSDTPGVPATTTGSNYCATQNEVWFTFTPSTTGAYRIDTCGGSADTAIAVYEGSCGSLLELACNDDFCLLGSAALVTLTAGMPYWVSVGTGDAFAFPTVAGSLNIAQLVFPAAAGSVSAWSGAVATGTPASFTMTDLIGPTVADIGMTNGANGVSYEFIVHGTAEGDSSGLMGVLASGVGDAAGFKFEQWSNTLAYGVTEFGIADYSFLGPTVTENADLHLVFVVDTTLGETELFVNGTSAGTTTASPVLQGEQGIGFIYRPNNRDLDPFFGKVRGVAVYEAMLTPAEIVEHHNVYFNGGLGTQYCGPGVPNSTGNSGQIAASGSLVAAANDVTLTASDIPRFTFGFFITSQTQGFVMMPGGSQGNLCLSGAVGRYVGPGQIQNSGNSNEISLPLNLTQMPQPNGFVSALPGQTWNFQLWHRDSVGTPTSNFTNGVSLTFQ